MEVLAWHYTTFHNYMKIQETGLLKPAVANIDVDEVPVIWFSTERYFEPTAIKAILDPETGGIRRCHGVEEMLVHGGGLVRFGVPVRLMMTGDRLRKAAHISLVTWKRLAKTAKQQGGNSSNWWGHLGELPIEGLPLQYWPIGEEWRSGGHQDVKAYGEHLEAMFRAMR